jgi:hypothetical protein
MLRVLKQASVELLAVALAVAAAGCNIGNTVLSTSGLPNVQGQLSFRVVGVIGTPFTAILSDARSSWRLRGTVPTTFAIMNGQLPARMILTKTASNNNLVSLEIINGYTPTMLASTSQPYGIVQVQIGGTLGVLAPQAGPDVRFGLRAPLIALITGNIEDLNSSFTIEQRVPTVFLFDSPHGRVDGIFNLDNLGAGSMTIDLQYQTGANPTVVCQQTSNSGRIIIKYPGCTATQVPQAAGLEASDATELPDQVDLNSSD